jgi:hypothetical protein
MCELCRSDHYRTFYRLPCALWTDPASCVGDFVVLSRDFPAFNVNWYAQAALFYLGVCYSSAVPCTYNSASHGPFKVVKWKKSGSPQYRDLAGGADEQLMSQFAGPLQFFFATRYQYQHSVDCFLNAYTAVARSLADNSKAFSARVTCIVRSGEAQGVHVVQVRGPAGKSGLVLRPLKLMHAFLLTRCFLFPGATC